MSALPSSSEHLASDTSAYPERDALVGSSGYGKAGVFDGRSSEEVGLFDIVLPRAASKNGTKRAQRSHQERTRRSSSCSSRAEKQPDFVSKASDGAAESSFDVRVVQTEKGQNSEGRSEAEGHAQQDVVNKEENEGRGEEVEQEEAHTDEENDYGKKRGFAGNIFTEVNLETRQAPALRKTKPCTVSDSSADGYTNVASSPVSDSNESAVKCHTEVQLDIPKGNDAKSSCRCEEETVMITTASAGRVRLAVAVTGEDPKLAGNGEGEHTANGVATACVEPEKLHVRTEAAGTLVGKEGPLKGEDTQQLKLPTLPARKRGPAGSGEAKPSHIAAVAANQQCVSCGLGGIDEATTSRPAHPKAELSRERPYHKETSADETCEPQEVAEKSRKVESVLTVERDNRRRPVGEGGFTAVGAHAVSGSSVRGDSGTTRSDILQISSEQSGKDSVEQNSMPLAKAEKLTGKKRRDPSSKVRTDVEQLTSSYSQDRGRSLVSSRRQLFEQRRPHDSDRHSPPKPLLFKERDPVQFKGEQMAKETTLVAAEQGGGCRNLVFRKGSVVERLRERYESSTSRSSIGSVRTQPPASNRALSTTSTRVEEGKPEPTWRRRQREKLQLAQEAAGQTPPALANAAGSKLKEDSTFSEAVGGFTERQDFGYSPEIVVVFEGSPPATEVAVKSETTSAPATCKSNASLKDTGDRMRKNVITVHGGECSTVTSLKKKFERRERPLKEGRQQQTHQPQHVQQQRQQTVLQPVEATKLLRPQYERRKLLEENKGPLPCQLVATTASTPVAAKTPVRLPEQDGRLGESSINQQGDSATASATARTPVKCLKEQYQRLLTAGATASPRAAAPITIVTSTNVKSARELLGSVDIVGRYGKPYWVAKAEGALKRGESHTSAEEFPTTAPQRRFDTPAEAIAPVATSTAEAARRSDGGCTGSRARDASGGLRSGERGSSRQESSTSGNDRALEGGSDRTQGHYASVAWKREAPVDVSTVEPKSRVGGCKAAGRSGAEAALRIETTESAAGTPQRDVRHSGGEQSPTVSAHASSKIGALASALGPACINFGKAPPPRLLTRAEADADTEETDPEIYGYSKAHEAIERRKRELKLLVKATSSNRKEQGDACCAENTPVKTRSIQSGLGARTRRNSHSSEEQECESNLGEGEISSTSSQKKPEEYGDSGSDEETSSNTATKPYLSSRRGSGEAHESSWSSAEREMGSNAAGQILNFSGTKQQPLLSHTGDSNSSSGSKRMLGTYDRIDLYSFSNGAGNEETNSESSGAGRKSFGCRREEIAGFTGRDSSDLRSDTEAQNGTSDRETHPSGSRVAFKADETRPTAGKVSDSSTETLLCLHLPYAERDEPDTAPAEAVERKPEAESCRLPPVKADRAATPGGEKTDRETNKQSFSGRRKDEKPAGGRKKATACNEAQAGQVEGTLFGEEQTTALGDALTKAGRADLTREEQVRTKYSEDATTGKSFHDLLSSVVGGPTHPFRSMANDEEEMEEKGLWEKRSDTVVEGGDSFEGVRGVDTRLPAVQEHSASEDAEENGGHTDAMVARGLQGRTSDDDEEMDDSERSDYLKEAVVEGGINSSGVQVGNTAAPVVEEYSETEDAEKDSGCMGVAVCSDWPEKVEPSSEVKRPNQKQLCCRRLGRAYRVTENFKG